MNTKQFLLGLTLSAMVGGGAALGGYKLLEENNLSANSQSVQNNQVRLSNFMHDNNVVVPEGLNFISAAELVTPAVVHVMTSYNAQPASYQNQIDPFFREFFGDNFRGFNQPQRPQQGFGSGVIIASNGYIVTNNHVIDRADKIEVVMDDKRKFEATLIGKDPNTDIALLKIDSEELPFIRYGNSDNLKVGEWVLAVGNPMNLTSTVTAGIVSAKGRNINILRNKDNMGIESFIQTDAAVNPGNSGGALVNLNGDLVGINTAIASQTGSYSGYSFAVPASIVSKVVDDLLKYGEVQRALLGVSIREVDAALAKEKDIKDLAGVYVNGTAAGSAASEAGIKEGDVIREINGIRINTSAQLQEQVARFRPGDKINVKYTRDGKTKSSDVVLKNTMGDTEIVKHAAAKTIELEGAVFEPVSKSEMNKLNLDGGAKISNVKSSKFRETGIRDGFIITNIDKQDIQTPQDVEKMLTKRTGGILIEGLYPDGRKAYYAIGW